MSKFNSRTFHFKLLQSISIVPDIIAIIIPLYPRLVSPCTTFNLKLSPSGKNKKTKTQIYSVRLFQLIGDQIFFSCKQCSTFFLLFSRFPKYFSLLRSFNHRMPDVESIFRKRRRKIVE